MHKPIEICLENIDLPEEDHRYLRCVALPDAEPGLALDTAGEVIWMPEEPSATGFWVSGDGQLILIRSEAGAAIWAERAGRSVEAPAGKPVVLLDQDLLRIGTRRLRVHVHGPTEEIYPPELIPASALRRLARSAATAIALGAATLAGGAASGQPANPGHVPAIEVRATPPAPRPRPRKAVDCEVKSIKSAPKGIVVQARCPAKAEIYKGMRGRLMANKKPLSRGAVVVKSVTKGKVMAEGRALPKEKATHIRFMVHHDLDL